MFKVYSRNRRKKFNKTLVWAAASILFAGMLGSCGPKSQQKDSFSDCPYGNPEAIFSSGLDSVSSHTFDLYKEEAVEEVRFTNGWKLTLIQSGCDYIRQEYRFALRDSFPDNSPEFWLGKTLDIFQYLSRLSEKHSIYSVWGSYIGQYAEDFKLGRPQELGEGITAEIDRIISDEEAILMVVLEKR